MFYTEEDFLADIAAFCLRHNMRKTEFGIKATGNGNMVRHLTLGRSPQVKTVNKVRQWMKDYDERQERLARVDKRVDRDFSMKVQEPLLPKPKYRRKQK